MPFSAGFDYRDTFAQLPLYTSRVEMERVFSKEGVNFRVDDDLDSVVSVDEELILVDAMAEGTDLVNAFALHRYEPFELMQSRIVRRMASYFACNALSMHRGNSPQFETKCLYYEKFLVDVKNNTQTIGDAKPRAQMGMAMSNVALNRNFYSQPLRVDRRTSIGADNGHETTDYDSRRRRGWGWFSG